jgi:hypothetical protein
MKTVGELRCSGKDNSSWSTCYTRLVNVKWHKLQNTWKSCWIPAKFSFKQGWSTIPTESTFVWFINWKCVLFIKIDKFIMQWRTAGQRFSSCTLVSSTNKTDRHDILKYCWIVLNTGQINERKMNVAVFVPFINWFNHTLPF